ncbi:alpha/beta hydrolase family protein [Pseudonocardia sp. TRM90224]|uniref:alpha/beta hydrolase family protein n=1 Tax=Pseudonocardia sp. TRM90224 TaxID=2812678 RepID=UPI001E4DFF77|nr:alpha/beta fold hydrolase [Pseudonocardia sp. TRM90224]
MVMLRRIGAGASIGLGLGFPAAAVGIGWFYSSVLLDTTQQPVFPERVLAVDGSTITLKRSRLAAQPGLWGLRWPEGLAVMGRILETDRKRVVRERVGGDLPPVGTATVLDTGPYDPDPAARGLPFADVEVKTELGPCPAWHVPGGDTWVVMVHGRGGSRREALRVLPALSGLDLSVLAITYRNDEDAPPSPDGRYHLGDTEWADVEAAVRFARANGAARVVLFAWSMGGAVTAAFLDRSAEADAVAAVVWDAPLVDWRATLRQQARNRRLPPGLTPLATSITSRRIKIDFDRFDLIRSPPAVRPPTLLIHTTDDTAVPVAPSRALAAAAPALRWPMRYVEVPGIEHTAAWNLDPEAYEREVTAFLSGVLN